LALDPIESLKGQLREIPILSGGDRYFSKLLLSRIVDGDGK
jgi:hypothetical protein